LTNLLYAYYVSYFLPSIYQERFSAFQEDLLSIQQGKYAVSKLTNGTKIFIVAVFMVETHPALRECISDLEKARQQVIYQARLIMEYHIDCTNEQFQAEVAGLEEDYLVYIMEYVCMYVCNNSILKPRRFQAEKQAMRDMMLNALEEKRKRLRDEKDNENDIANGMLKALAVRITYSWMYESNCSSCSLQISSFLRIKRAIASVYYARGEEYLTRNLWLVTDRLIVW
jgi:hypothetical protein